MKLTLSGEREEDTEHEGSTDGGEEALPIAGDGQIHGRELDSK